MTTLKQICPRVDKLEEQMIAIKTDIARVERTQKESNDHFASTLDRTNDLLSDIREQFKVYVATETARKETKETVEKNKSPVDVVYKYLQVAAFVVAMLFGISAYIAEHNLN